MVRRGAQAVLLCVAMGMMLGASSESRFERLGHEMVCMCGCSQIMLECNHVGCPVSPIMIGELREQIAAGGSNKGILGWFTAKYGGIVLASPIRGGFDNVAWIMPILAFLVATLGTAVVVWIWKRRAGTASFAGSGGSFTMGESMKDAAMRERIRRETEYR